MYTHIQMYVRYMVKIRGQINGWMKNKRWVDEWIQRERYIDTQKYKCMIIHRYIDMQIYKLYFMGENLEKYIPNC